MLLKQLTLIPIIYFTLLFLKTTAFDLRDKTFKFTLTSNDKSKQIPMLLPCSCQLSVFTIYNNTYTATISPINRKQLYVKVYFQSSDTCVTPDVNAIIIDVNNTNFGGQTEITQRIYVQFLDEKQESCNNIHQLGEERLVYLVDKDNKEQYNYGIDLPDKAMIITQVVAFVALLALCQNIKYRRFTPFQFNFVFTVFYSVFLFSVVYFSTFFDDDNNATYYGVLIFSAVCLAFYFIDITSCCFHKPLTIIIISIILALLIIIVDLVIVPDVWFINDIIAFLVAGALIKFVVIKKMKNASLPMLFLWLFFILRQFAIDFHISNFQQALQIKIVPLFLQFPALPSESHGYMCSAFGTSKIITMGLILNYAVRVDLFLSSRFYTILVSIIAFVSMTVQLTISIFFDQLPVMQYISVIIFLPFSLTFVLLFAAKRGEWAQLWHGSFHDIAVDRKSVMRQSTILDDEEMNRNLDQLMMNPSLLSDH